MSEKEMKKLAAAVKKFLRLSTTDPFKNPKAKFVVSKDEIQAMKLVIEMVEDCLCF